MEGHLEPVIAQAKVYETAETTGRQGDDPTGWRVQRLHPLRYDLTVGSSRQSYATTKRPHVFDTVSKKRPHNKRYERYTEYNPQCQKRI